MLHRSTTIFLCTLATACVPQRTPIDSDSDSTSAATDTTGDGQSDTGPVNTTTAATTTSTPTTTTDPTTTPSTGLDTTTAEATSFIPIPDVGPDLSCNAFAQECPAGQKCTWYAEGGGSSWNATKCVDIADDPAGIDEPCTAEGMGVSGIDTCELGAMCWNVDQNGDGACIAFCSGSERNPTCAPETHCVTSGDGFALCIKTCDPLLQDCPGTDLCIPLNGDYLCTAETENAPLHSPCDFANGCEKGLICLESSAAMECDQDANGCCEPLCDLEQPECPGAGQQCLPVFDPQPAGSENVGFCSLMP